MSTASIALISDLIDIFHYNKELNFDAANNCFIPSLSSKHPYSLQCLINWVQNIEENNRIIELDFDKIEDDIKSLQTKYGDKINGLFYPNIESMFGFSDHDKYKRDQNNIKTIYYSYFVNNPSIIHYILNNHSYLFELDKPDVDGKQSKLDDIHKVNNESMIKLNMKQSIYILRLLIIKFNIISPDLIYEDQGTIIIDIDEQLRNVIIRYDFKSDDIRQLFLDLLIDLHSMSKTILQSAIINISGDNPNIEEEGGYAHVNFFDNIDVRYIGWGLAQLPPKLIKELIFRGIPPFIIHQVDETDDRGIWYAKKKQSIINHLYGDIFNKMINKGLVTHSNSIKAVTMPLIICDIANKAKSEMHQILDKYLQSVLSQDCIHCILSFIYMDWNVICPKYDDNDTMVKTGKFLNYMLEINFHDNKEEKEKFDKEYLTESMAKFLFKDLDEESQEILIKKHFFVDRYYTVDPRILYKLTKMQRLTTNMLHKLLERVLEDDTDTFTSNSQCMEILVMHMFDEQQLKDIESINAYKKAVLREIKTGWSYRDNGQLIDVMLDPELV